MEVAQGSYGGIGRFEGGSEIGNLQRGVKRASDRRSKDGVCEIMNADYCVYAPQEQRNAQAEQTMISLLQSKGVDDATIGSFRDQASAKEFLMDIPGPNTTGGGMCMATKSWLAQCGFGMSEIMNKAPSQLIQGPLTSQAHKTQMRNFFGGYDADYQATQKEPLEFVCDDLINYRRVFTSDPAGSDPRGSFESVPFKFKLTVRLLRSHDKDQVYKIWQAQMTEEQDLDQEEVSRLTQQAKADTHIVRNQTEAVTVNSIREAGGKAIAAAEGKTSAVANGRQPAWGTSDGDVCFACYSHKAKLASGVTPVTVLSELTLCLRQLGAHVQQVSETELRATAYTHQARPPVYFTCNVRDEDRMGRVPYACLSRCNGDVIEFMECCTTLEEMYNARNTSYAPQEEQQEQEQNTGADAVYSMGPNMGSSILDFISTVTPWIGDYDDVDETGMAIPTSPTNSMCSNATDLSGGDSFSYAAAAGQPSPSVSQASPDTHISSSAKASANGASTGFDPDTVEMLESYVNIADCDCLHPQMRLEAAYQVTAMCCEDRALFLETQCMGMGMGSPAEKEQETELAAAQAELDASQLTQVHEQAGTQMLRTMFDGTGMASGSRDSDELRRCGMVILTQLVKGEQRSAAAAACVRELCAEFRADVQEGVAQTENPEIKRLGTTLMPLINTQIHCNHE